MYGGRGQREKLKPNYQQNNRKNIHPYHYKNSYWLSSLDHCYAKDPCKEVDFRKQVSIITENLKTKKDSFIAGSISKSVESWREITSDKCVLQTVSKGVSIELEDLASIPLSTAHKTERLYSDSERTLFRKEICRLLQKSVIKQVKNLEKGYVPSTFLREKKDKTTHLLILNLKKINENAVYRHFKMSSLSTVLNMVRQDCYMASIDLTDACYTVPVLCID